MDNKYLVFCSGGNDSIALLQYMIEHNFRDVIVMYNDTGWAQPGWMDRIDKIKVEVEGRGYKFVITESKGFEQMVKDKKGFPMAASRMSFCTQELKTKPTLKWLQENDIEKELICCAGVRREESQNRANHKEIIHGAELYEGRTRWFPIVKIKETERDELIKRFGLDVLPHSSMECFPCINSNRSDFRLLAQYPDVIEHIAKLEKDMGFTSKGKPRLMFRPYRHMGAHGIKEVVKWGIAGRGKYKKSMHE
jgi:3'-phosphoadenosine 5'-phosphosulfate sulfotransferase (PAPS reductase)/FAD synthetase